MGFGRVVLLLACVCATQANYGDDEFEDTDGFNYPEHLQQQREVEGEPRGLRSRLFAWEEQGEERELRALQGEERGLRALVQEEKRNAFRCNQKSDTCKGVIRCCGTLQCYWPNGYSAIQSGRCVDCVQLSQQCQRDAQCCSPLVCQKGARHHVDGRCEERRPNGSECHENDQCRSANCRMSFANKVKGYGGVCS